MDKPEEKEKGFKVDDRRRFSPEGELKPEHRGADEKPQDASAQPAAGTQSASGAGGRAASASGGSASSASASRASAPGAGAAGHDTTAPVEIMFSTFIVGLSTQALIHLGEIPDPAGEQPEADLIGAQQLIDILGMLQEKTRGNLDAAEQKLLEAILFDLRMKYVEIARQAAH